MMASNQPSVIVVFGATGDLMRHKLMPAFYRLHAKGEIDKGLYFIGVGRREVSAEQFQEDMKHSLRDALGRSFDRAVWDELAERIRYERGFFEDPKLYERLVLRLARLDSIHKTRVQRFFYLATPPEHYETIIMSLAKSKLTNGRILIEKPFGKNLHTARRLDMLLAKHFDEKQIYRIDHYLGKETVQNILAFRFANGIFEPTWNKDFVDHVQMTLSETDSVGKRGAFYDGVGALRDVVQNHMLQMLALIAMDQPRAFDAKSIRDERANILKRVKPLSDKEVLTRSVRGQYEGYTNERGVSRTTRTETFTALKLELASSRWHGVPFYLRTGKRLAQKATEISIHYKKPIVCYGEVCLFKENEVLRNVLSIRIQPDDGIRLRLMIKKPEFGMMLTSTQMHFQYKEAFPDFSQPEAYDKLLMDAISGDQTLFARTDSVEASWQAVTKILEGWDERSVPLYAYPPGSMGPNEADTLIHRDGRHWFLSSD